MPRSTNFRPTIQTAPLATLLPIWFIGAALPDPRVTGTWASRCRRFGTGAADSRFM